MKHQQIVLATILVAGLVLLYVNWRPKHISCSSDTIPTDYSGRSSRTRDPRSESLSLGVPVAGEYNIFFVESSCGVSGPQRSTVSMTPRQACAVESAALLNPGANVYYVDTCLDLHAQVEAGHVASQALSYSNVKVFAAGLRNLAQDTPLEMWFQKGVLQHSSFPVEHSSDVARLLILWKYGGIYFDLDFVFVRPLSELGMDFVVAERDNWIANGVLSFSKTGLGHAVAHRCLKELAANFNGTIWSQNGPAIITKVLSTLCNSSSVKEMTQERCWGFTVHEPALFYPFRYMSWWLMFAESSSDSFMAFVLKNSTYGVHAWNKMSHATRVDVDSKQPYALLAKRFCPMMFSAVGSRF